MKSSELLEPLNPSTARPGTGKFPIVDLQYASRRALLSAARSQGSKLMLFAASDTELPVGKDVRLRISIAGTTQRFELFGTVLEHTWAGNGSRASGLTVGFQGDEKRFAAEMIAFCADRPRFMGTASSERQEVEIRCKVKGAYGSREAVIVDLSRTGAFIATEVLRGIHSGSRLSVQLEPSVLGLGGTWLEGKVIWLGYKGTHTGLGIQFVGVDEKQSKMLNKYLKAAHR
jgi:Tfp pilus assembly protein PilZ